MNGRNSGLLFETKQIKYIFFYFCKVSCKIHLNFKTFLTGEFLFLYPFFLYPSNYIQLAYAILHNPLECIELKHVLDS